jgi:hypothetical protein
MEPAAIFPEVGLGHPNDKESQSDFSIRAQRLSGRNAIYQAFSCARRNTQPSARRDVPSQLIWDGYRTIAAKLLKIPLISQIPKASLPLRRVPVGVNWATNYALTWKNLIGKAQEPNWRRKAKIRIACGTPALGLSCR